MAHLYPSLIAADPLYLGKAIQELDLLTYGYHCDVMDGIFVPTLGLSIDAINDIARLTGRELWVHLMVQNPHEYLDQLLIAPGSIITFHLESKGGVLEVIKKITEKNFKPSLAISPQTPVNDVFPFLALLHQVTIMSVNPGYSGQVFLKETVAKIKPLIGFRNTAKLSFLIAMDGGVGLENIGNLCKEGVDEFAIGSALFENKNPGQALKLMIERCKR